MELFSDDSPLCCSDVTKSKFFLHGPTLHTLLQRQNCFVFYTEVLPCRGSWCWNQMSGRFLNRRSCNCQPAAPAPGVCWNLHSSSLPHKQKSHSWYQAGCCSPVPQTSAWTGCHWDVIVGVLQNSSGENKENKKMWFFFSSFENMHKTMAVSQNIPWTSLSPLPQIWSLLCLNSRPQLKKHHSSLWGDKLTLLQVDRVLYNHG